MGVWGLFIGTMLTTFPATILGAYGIDFFECPAKQPRGAPVCDEVKQKSVAYNMFAIMGIQVFYFPALCINFAREGVSQKAQRHTKPCIAQRPALSLTPLGSTRLPASQARSVLCFMAIPTHAWFVVGEIMVLPNSAMPKEGHYFNIVLWTTFIILSYLGWKESGAVLPDTDALIPKGRFGTPLLVWAINNTISYGLPLVLLRDKMMEQYAVRAYADLTTR